MHKQSKHACASASVVDMGFPLATHFLVEMHVRIAGKYWFCSDSKDTNGQERDFDLLRVRTAWYRM